MKNSLSIIVILCLVGWNIVLTFQKDESESLDYRVLQEYYKQLKRGIEAVDSGVKILNTKINENNSFVDSANSHQLDSLESIFLRR